MASTKGPVSALKKEVGAKSTPSSPSSSRPGSPIIAPKKFSKSGKSSGKTTPIFAGTPRLDAQQDPADLNMAALNLQPISASGSPKISAVLKDRQRLLEEVRATLEPGVDGKMMISLVVIGHVDAGKSTLMGRLLYELGRTDDKRHATNERAAEKLGKASFSWAWEMDASTEERERGVTIDISQQFFTTKHRQITILDAPGHKDFIPNMISGATQADCALLVVDASTGEFEAGFERGGQTREHLVLVRSLGVTQVIVAINKLDQVSWSEERYNEVSSTMQPFLSQVGFPMSKIRFIPVGAFSGVNLVDLKSDAAEPLRQWYKGPTLVELLDILESPARPIEAHLRVPITNVFRGQTSLSSGIAVTGRVITGIMQVGERLAVLPGTESAIVRLLEVEEDSVQWAAAGANVTIYLAGIDPIHLSVGCVLCHPESPIPLVSIFTGQIIIFDVQVPLIAGSSIELFHQARNVPASLSKLIASLDRSTGEIIKKNPRVLSKGISARVEITIRTTTLSGQSGIAGSIPLETFRANKDMGRILIRRNGETVAAGIVTDIIS